MSTAERHEVSSRTRSQEPESKTWNSATAGINGESRDSFANQGTNGVRSEATCERIGNSLNPCHGMSRSIRVAPDLGSE
jgi:hypothetical protein